jgi:hypothetical protein
MSPQGVMFSQKAVTALDCVLLKDSKLALAPRQDPQINSQACLWVSPRTRYHIQCWLTNQRQILLRISCLETPKAGSGPTNFRTQPSLANLSAISFPHTPACPRTQYSPTACRVEISFNHFWHCWTNEDLFWWPEELWKPHVYQSRYSHTEFFDTSSTIPFSISKKCCVFHNFIFFGFIKYLHLK